MTGYVLDSCVFIDAHRHYYGLNFCSAFWDWLIISNQQGRIYSIDLVLREILDSAEEDDLYRWSKSDGLYLFQNTVNSDIEKISNEIESWLVENEFTNTAIVDFKEGADVALIAHAKLHNQTVVTLEKSSDSIYKVKNPVVCKGLGVPVVDTFKMLRTESPEFVLKSK